MHKTKPFTYDFLLLFLVTIFFYLPVIINKSILLNRGNDLEEQFWPTYYFIKNNIFQSHIFPLWNNRILSGLPLLPDPQFSLFYPPNWLMVLLPLDLAFVLFFIIHTFLAGIGMYLLTKYGFKFSRFVSLVIAALYIFSPKSGEFVVAGHYGLLATTAWLPLLLLSLIMLIRQPKLKWLLIFGLSLAGLFYTHTVIFLIAAFTATLILFWSFVNHLTKKLFKTTAFFGFGVLLAFGLTAVTLLPQTEWIPETTRTILLQERDIYPKWFSVKELALNSLAPWLSQYGNFWSIDTEKWLVLGIFPIILAFIGFWNLPQKTKLGLLILATLVLLISLNNASPLNKLLLTQDWFVLMRVATRVWFIAILAILILCGFGLEYLKDKRINQKVLIVIITLLLIESLALSWSRLFKPLPDQSRFASNDIYQFLKHDPDQFRIFCVNRCLSQKEAAKNNLELVEGYNTLLQLNYYQYAWKFTNEQWHYYTLAIPPIGLYKYDQIQPDPKSLGLLNTKYIISPHTLNNLSFKLVKDGAYKIYTNNDYQPRAFYLENNKPGQKIPVLVYEPNLIRLDTSSHAASQIVLSEVYSKGWRAYLNGKEQIEIFQSPEILRMVNIKKDTNFVEFRYEPRSFVYGSIITIISFLAVAISFVYLKRKNL